MSQFGFKQIRYLCLYLQCSVLVDLLYFKNVWGISASQSQQFSSSQSHPNYHKQELQCDLCRRCGHHLSSLDCRVVSGVNLNRNSSLINFQNITAYLSRTLGYTAARYSVVLLFTLLASPPTLPNENSVVQFNLLAPEFYI
jgi:hypothetical protein